MCLLGGMKKKKSDEVACMSSDFGTPNAKWFRGYRVKEFHEDLKSNKEAVATILSTPPHQGGKGVRGEKGRGEQSRGEDCRS